MTRTLSPGLYRWHLLARRLGKKSSPVSIECGDVSVLVTSGGAEVELPAGEAVFSCPEYKGCARLTGERYA